MTVSENKRSGVSVKRQKLGEVWLSAPVALNKIERKGPDPKQQRAKVRAHFESLRRAKLDTRNIRQLGKR